MNIDQSYTILKLSHAASDDEISANYKKLAMQYHPDRNQHRLAWAHEAMTALNEAYTLVISHRFRLGTIHEEHEKPNNKNSNNHRTKDTSPNSEVEHDRYVDYFVQLKESVKDALYRYYQYSLYNLQYREKLLNISTYNSIIKILRISYHNLQQLAQNCNDNEIEKHCLVFSSMIYSFYRSSECVTVIDSYDNRIDVEAFMQYRQGDDYLTEASREIFYERHNRGTFKTGLAYQRILQSIAIFEQILIRFSHSSWTVESSIKSEYALTLKNYIELFFNER